MLFAGPGDLHRQLLDWPRRVCGEVTHLHVRSWPVVNGTYFIDLRRNERRRNDGFHNLPLVIGIYSFVHNGVCG